MNFELLRIISMLMIVTYHFSDWGGILNIENNFPNKLFGEFINIFGKLGVNLFVLISGYFLKDSKFKFKKLLKLILEVLFYSIGIYIICICFNIEHFSIKGFIKVCLPITYNMYWFATAYVGLYLLSPFINKLINNMKRIEHKTLILLLLIMTSIIPTFLPKSNPYNSNLIWFIFIYIVAAYIKRYNVNYTNNKKNLLLVVLIIIGMFGFSVIATKLNLSNNFITYFNNMQSIPILILSILIFIYFKNLDIKNNSIILFFSKSTFAVYLIHINANLRTYLFHNILKIDNYYNANILELVQFVCISVLVIFFICTIIDTIRRKILEDQIFKIKKFDKYFTKIDYYINGE